MSERSPSPEFDDEYGRGVQDRSGIFVPLLVWLGVAYGIGSALGATGFVAVLAGLVLAYALGKVLGSLWRRFADWFNNR
jgi:hypothetical protein